MKLKKILFIFLIIFSFAPLFASGAGPRLENTYPPMPLGATPPVEGSYISIANYVRYIFVFVLVASAIIAVVMIAVGGIEYMASTGSPQKMGEAMARVKAAVFGIVILGCSYGLLYTINPSFVNLQDPDIQYLIGDISPGVWFCKQRVDMTQLWNEKKNAKDIYSSNPKGVTKAKAEEIRALQYQVDKNCYNQNTSGAVRDDFVDNITFIYLVPIYQQTEFGVILYSETTKLSKARVIYGNGQDDEPAVASPSEWPNTKKAATARIFTIYNGNSGNSYAMLYQLPHFNKGFEETAKKVKCYVPQGKSEDYCDISPLVPENDKTSMLLKNKSLGMLLAQNDNINDIINNPNNYGGLDNGSTGSTDSGNTGSTGSTDSGSSGSTGNTGENGPKPPKISSVEFNGKFFLVLFKNKEESWTEESEIDIVGPGPETNVSSTDYIMDGWDTDCKEKTAEQPNGKSYPCARDAILVSAELR